jgi:predicted aspartyl protease
MRIIKVSFFLAIITVVCSFYAAAQKSPVVDVPMRFLGTRPAIEVMVNGQGPFLFLIDTGAEGLARLDSSLVERLGIKPVGKIEASDSRGSRMIDEYQLDTLSIGGIEFKSVKAPSRNYNTSTAPNAPRFDGILGFNIFAEFLLTLDYQGNRVRIEKGELPKPDQSKILSFESPYGTPILELSLGNMKVKADVDSGDGLGLTIPTSVAEKLRFASEPNVTRKGESISGKFEIKEVKLKDTLRVGRYKFLKPKIQFTDAFDNINLGAGMQREFSITFDQKNKRVRFERKSKIIKILPT